MGDLHPEMLSWQTLFPMFFPSASAVLSSAFMTDTASSRALFISFKYKGSSQVHCPLQRPISLHWLKAALNDVLRLRCVPLKCLIEGDLHLSMCISRDSWQNRANIQMKEKKKKKDLGDLEKYVKRVKVISLIYTGREYLVATQLQSIKRLKC